MPHPDRGTLDAARYGAALAAFGAVILLIWWLVTEYELVSRFALAPPADTAEALWAQVKDIASGGVFFEAVRITGLEVLGGFVLATVLGISLGIVAGDTRFGESILMPYIIAVSAAPTIALAPVFVTWLGFGVTAKMALGALTAFFPIVINTALGVRASTSNELLLFQALEASRTQALLRLKLPNALPYIFAGLRLGIVLSVVGAIVGEFAGGTIGPSERGMGGLIRAFTELLEIEQVLALILLLSFGSILLYAVVAAIERRVVHWRTDELIRRSSAMGGG